ncbi:MAG: metallophosphoesterase family protein [Actinobacteria bacterium]|nr:MAG: metallophosphoesterase family protein [Actinomycetota bacterium]TMM28023.1 MAG: metallophosphoesterase family protein [Actinomycetota bacterium]
MRLALISDIHANLLALDAVLGELNESVIDRLVCLGDVAAGPEPRETIERLREVGCPVVLGNWDTWMLEGVPELEVQAGPKLRDQGTWSAAQLEEPDKAFLRALPPRIELELEGKTVLCVHGSPRSALEDIHATTSDAELAQMLNGTKPAVLAAGHTHVQLARLHGSTLIVNPGSVGLPFNSWPPNGALRMSPWAEYAILTVEDGCISTELRRAPYDVSALLDTARKGGMPHQDWWGEQWLVPART